MAVVTMKQLLEAGIHFGHQTRRWNPKMAKYIFGQRNGIYIIDLQETLKQARAAYAHVRDSVAAGGSVLFVGTKRQARDAIEREAKRCGMYYVNTRWLGGTLTNFQTIKQSVSTLVRFEEMEETGEFDKLSKKEASRLQKYYAKLKRNLGGIKEMSRPPAVMFVIDSKKEAIAVREAARLGITCVAIVDTNADPDAVALPVPGNDDAIRAVNLFCSIIADAVIDGGAAAEKERAEEMARSGKLTPKPAPVDVAKPESAEEPVAEAAAEVATEEDPESAEPEAEEPAVEESEGDE